MIKKALAAFAVYIVFPLAVVVALYCVLCFAEYASNAPAYNAIFDFIF